MKAINPYKIFIAGLLFTIITSTLYYFIFPEYEYFRGGYMIYKPGESLPESMTNDQAISSTYLLFRLSQYMIIYWLIFSILYFLVEKIKDFEFSKRSAWTHFVLAITGTLLLIYLNNYIISQHSGGSYYLSDSYVGEQLTSEQTVRMYQWFLWYDSITSFTSVIGIILCASGGLVFVIGFVRAWTRM